MSGFFSWLNWSAKSAHRELRSTDQNPQWKEGRLLRSGSYAEVEHHLSQKIAEADLRNFSPARRIALRLELAEAQRKESQGIQSQPIHTTLEDKVGASAAWLAASERTARQAIALAAQVSDGAAYVQALDVLAGIFGARNEWRAVEQVTAEALRLGARLPHPDPLQMARRVQRLGTARHWNGRPAEAVEALEKALVLHEQHYGGDHLETANLLFESGKIYRAQGDYERAHQNLKRAFYAHRAQLGEAAPQVFEDLQQWAGSLEESGDIDAAAEQHERSLQIKARQLGSDHLDELGEMQFSLANLYIGWENLSRARELLTEATGTFRRAGGARLAVCLEALAHVEEISGRHFGALRELESAAKAWEKCGPARFVELVRNLQYRADLLDQLRKHREASWLRERAQQYVQKENSMAASI